MKKIFYSFFLVVLAVSCRGEASLEGRIEGVSSGRVVVKYLDGASLKAVDSMTVTSAGKFARSVPVAAGEPEVAYLYYGPRRVASLILRKGDRIRIETDTLGRIQTLKGSEESALLQQADSLFAAFSARTRGLEGPAFTKEYVDLYRQSVAFVMQHSHSLATVPVLLRKVTPDLPVFGQSTDGMIFSNIADSLATVYPDSRYLRTLRAEAARRQQLLELSAKLAQAEESAFPEVDLPDTRAQQVKLSEVEAPLVMLYFWSTSKEEKMFNLDALLPLYADFHGKGLEIFAVALDPDKAEWAATVKRQGLTWINVCDIRGAASPLIGLYGITQLPMVYFIKHGEIDPDAHVSDAASIRSYVSSVLK